MSAMASQITSLTVVYSTVYSGSDQRKHQSSVSLAFVRRIHRWPVNSPQKWPVTRKMFPFDDVIMRNRMQLLASDNMITLWHGNTFRITEGNPGSHHRGSVMRSFNVFSVVSWEICWRNCQVVGDLRYPIRKWTKESILYPWQTALNWPSQEVLGDGGLFSIKMLSHQHKNTHYRNTTIFIFHIIAIPGEKVFRLKRGLDFISYNSMYSIIVLWMVAALTAYIILLKSIFYIRCRWLRCMNANHNW